MAIKPKILIMGLVDVSGNPRPRRLVGLLRNYGYEVHVASFAMARPIDIDAHYEIPYPSMRFDLRLLRKGIRALNAILPFKVFDLLLEELRWKYSALKNSLGGIDFDAVVVEDLYMLPFALDVFGDDKIIFDAREYYPGEFEASILWKLIERPTRVRMCRQYMPRCRCVFTVSQGLVEKYQSVFGVKPLLMRSVPNFVDMQVRNVPAKKIRLVHHGVANRDRRLENIIDIFSKLDDRFEMDFFLGGNEIYRDELRAYAKKIPELRILDPVPFDDIVTTLNDYDMGVCYFEPVTFNLQHCLPNKLFEFIQARLAVISGPSPDIAAILNKYNCGVVVNDFDVSAMADSLNALSANDIQKMKENSNAAARELSYENEGVKILNVIREIVSTH